MNGIVVARIRRVLALTGIVALLTAGCITSGSVVTGDETEPSPTPTVTPTVTKPVFIPTTPPSTPTPIAIPTPATLVEAEDDDATSTDDDAADDSSDVDEEPTPTPEPTPEPTPAPAPAATTAPAAEATATPVPVPPTATPTPAPRCPDGKVLNGSSCACPSGTTERPGDGLCVPLCKPAQLTIANDCVCTGAYEDTGGQCVEICTGALVRDDFGGCIAPSEG